MSTPVCCRPSTAERPILFSGPMVRAILQGTKTQTRRIIKPQPPSKAHPFFIVCSSDKKDEGKWRFTRNIDHLSGTVLGPIACPYGKPGDLLWVREAHALSANPGLKPWYRLDHPEACGSGPRVDIKWRPSIHMPRWASRITLEITRVRVQKLKAISDADAREEGITDYCGKWWDGSPVVCGNWSGPTMAYQGLWQSIHGPGSWEANPWAWVVEFRRIEEVKP